nr:MULTISPECIES: trypsin-like peptidase domain-containing protein [unclassified Blastococcus]
MVEIRSSTGLGSGVVYDDAGHIVTNAHVVGADKDFDVLTSGSATPLQATLVGTFQPDDIAVIKVDDPAGLEPATFADSSDVHVGDIVLAMGNPLGLSATVTDGIVSALGREVSEPATEFSPPATLPNTIQTSAAINPGNSGGALVNLDGHVIGIPTVAATNAEAGGLAPGIGFAIPSNTVRRLADQLIATGAVTESGRAALGVGVTTVVDASGQPRGVGVVSVDPGGPADQAGPAGRHRRLHQRHRHPVAAGSGRRPGRSPGRGDGHRDGDQRRRRAATAGDPRQTLTHLPAVGQRLDSRRPPDPSAASRWAPPSANHPSGTVPGSPLTAGSARRERRTTSRAVNYGRRTGTPTRNFGRCQT